MSDGSKNTSNAAQKSLYIKLLIGLLVLFLGYELISGSLRINKNKARISEIKEEQKILNSDIDYLEYQISISNTLEFVERIAREEYGMVKPKEIIYVDKNRKSGSFSRYLNMQDNNSKKDN